MIITLHLLQHISACQHNFMRSSCGTIKIAQADKIRRRTDAKDQLMLSHQRTSLRKKFIFRQQLTLLARHICAFGNQNIHRLITQLQAQDIVQQQLFKLLAHKAMRAEISHMQNTLIRRFNQKHHRCLCRMVDGIRRNFNIANLHCLLGPEHMITRFVFQNLNLLFVLRIVLRQSVVNIEQRIAAHLAHVQWNPRQNFVEATNVVAMIMREEYRIVLLLTRSQAFDLQRFFMLAARQILAKVNANFCCIRANQSYAATNLVGMKKFYVSGHGRTLLFVHL